MWAKAEFDDKTRARDFLSLHETLANISPDITNDLAYILGKCSRNTHYCRFAKADLIRLAQEYEKIRTSLEALCKLDPKLKTLLDPITIKQNPVTTARESLQTRPYVAKL